MAQNLPSPLHPVKLLQQPFLAAERESPVDHDSLEQGSPFFHTTPTFGGLQRTIYEAPSTGIEGKLPSNEESEGLGSKNPYFVEKGELGNGSEGYPSKNIPLYGAPNIGGVPLTSFPPTLPRTRSMPSSLPSRNIFENGYHLRAPSPSKGGSKNSGSEGRRKWSKDWMRKTFWKVLWRKEEENKRKNDGFKPQYLKTKFNETRNSGLTSSSFSPGKPTAKISTSPGNGNGGGGGFSRLRGGGDTFRKEVGTDWERAVIWAFRGGVRCFILGFGFRSILNVVVTVVKTIGRGKLRGFHKAIWNAIFAQNSLRMAAMLSIFTGLYRFSTAALRLSRDNLGEEKYWDAAMGGAVASLAILAEAKEKRLDLAQQIFIRGCRGLVHVAQFKGWNFPKHGDSILFGLACGQIVYATFCNPDSLKGGYRRWVIEACQFPELSGSVLAEKFQYGSFDTKRLEPLLDSPGLTPANRTGLERLYEGAKAGDFGPPVLPCGLISHPNFDSCSIGIINKFMGTFMWIAPIYSTVHIVSSLLFKRISPLHHPITFIKRASIDTLRSCSFLSTFVAILNIAFCSRSNLINTYGTRLPQFLRKAMMGGQYFWLTGFMAMFSLYWEHKKRRAELAMYCISKALDSLRNIVRQKPYVPSTIYGGEVLLMASGMSIVMSCYRHHPTRLSRLVRQLLYQLVGRA